MGASFFINGFGSSLDLLYPCQIEENLTRTQIISALKTYDSRLSQAFYSPDEAEVSGKNAVFGSYESGSFVAFQPSANTVAALFFSSDVGRSTQAELLGNLDLVINETTTPLTPNYCSQINSTSAGNGSVASMPSSSSVSPPMTIISQAPMQPQQAFFRGMGPSSEARMARIEAALESLNSARAGFPGEVRPGQREPGWPERGHQGAAGPGQREPGRSERVHPRGDWSIQGEHAL